MENLVAQTRRTKKNKTTSFRHLDSNFFIFQFQTTFHICRKMLLEKDNLPYLFPFVNVRLLISFRSNCVLNSVEFKVSKKYRWVLTLRDFAPLCELSIFHGKSGRTNQKKKKNKTTSFRHLDSNFFIFQFQTTFHICRKMLLEKDNLPYLFFFRKCASLRSMNKSSKKQIGLIISSGKLSFVFGSFLWPLLAIAQTLEPGAIVKFERKLFSQKLTAYNSSTKFKRFPGATNLTWALMISFNLIDWYIYI